MRHDFTDSGGPCRLSVHFESVDEESFIVQCGSSPTLVFSCVNYEERSVAFLNRILSERGLAQSLHLKILWPQGTTGQVDLLEELKSSHYATIQSPPDGVVISRRVFSYPSDFDENFIVDEVKSSIATHFCEDLTVVVDISCIPRKVLIAICKGLEEYFMTTNATCFSIFFLYSSPVSYAVQRYPQNVGILRGYFSGRSIHDCALDRTSALIFPSVQGFEGKLVHDEVRAKVRGTVSALVSVSGHDYLTSIATMRSNQFLMEQLDVRVAYYFSLHDGIRKLCRMLKDEASACSQASDGPFLMLIAPFGPKLFTVASYFYLKELQSLYLNCKTEMAHVSGFQYLSLYSLGFSHFTISKLDFRS